MILLIYTPLLRNLKLCDIFKFHYDSINLDRSLLKKSEDLSNLNSIMILLISSLNVIKL